MEESLNTHLRQRPRILITGASGLLGANFVIEAMKRSHTVIALCHRHAIDLPGTQSWPLDITNRTAVHTVVEAVRPDWIVHCAAVTDVEWSERFPQETHRVNVEGSKSVAEAAHANGARLVHVSTDSVFSGEHGSYVEDDVPQPINVYAKSKLAAEHAVLLIAPNALIVRTNVYGWNLQPKQSLAEWVVSELSAGRRVGGWQDIRFTPILANDLCNIILDMMDYDLEGVFHVAGGNSCTKYEFACAAARQFGLDTKLVTPSSMADYGGVAPRPRDTSLKTGKIQAAIGRPMPSVSAGLARFKLLRDVGFPSKLKTYGKE